MSPDVIGDEKLSFTSGWHCLKTLLFALKISVETVHDTFHNYSSWRHHAQQMNWWGKLLITKHRHRGSSRVLSLCTHFPYTTISDCCFSEQTLLVLGLLYCMLLDKDFTTVFTCPVYMKLCLPADKWSRGNQTRKYHFDHLPVPDRCCDICSYIYQILFPSTIRKSPEFHLQDS